MRRLIVIALLFCTAFTAISGQTNAQSDPQVIETEMLVKCSDFENWTEEAQTYVLENNLCSAPGARGSVTGTCGTSTFHLVDDGAANNGGYVYQYLSTNAVAGIITAVNWYYYVSYFGGSFSTAGYAAPFSSYWSRNGFLDIPEPSTVLGYMGGDVSTFNGFTCSIQFPSSEAYFS